MSDTGHVVLCVEDEVLVRMFLSDALTDVGFRVLEAVSPEEALLIFQARPDVAVVVTDVEMGGNMDGFALARAVRERSTNVQVIVMSGRSWPQAGDLPAGMIFLAKPVSAARLADEVAKAAAQAERMTGLPVLIAKDGGHKT